MVSFAAKPATTQAAPAVEPGANPAKSASTSTAKENAEVRPLDILFLQDATGSQGPYITSARSAITDICEKISLNTSLSKASIRFGLIAFRDHPPQDMTFVTKNFGFTSDVKKMTKNLASLVASGGGDGPEAQTAALAEALNMEWAENAVKIVVLITDAPPHGLGESGDGFDKSPDQNDPLDIVRQMAERGITLYVIACEPSLSRYIHAVDFYRAICQICSGRMVPLLNASQLGDFIVGSAVETIETEKLINEFQGVILEDVYGQGKPIEEVMNTVQQQMQQRGVQIQTLNVEDIYQTSAEADFNTNLWAQASSLGSAKGKTKKVGSSRLKSEFASPSLSPSPTGLSPMAMAAPGSGYGSPFGMSWRGSTPRGAAAGPAAYGAPPPPPAPMAAPGATAASYYMAALPQQQMQQVSMASQQVDQAQTKRVVMQSLMRSAKVGPGNVLTPTGDYASKPAVSSASYAASPSGTEQSKYEA